MSALFAEIAKHGKPVKIHNFGPDWLPALRELAIKHRDLPIILAHGGSFGTGAFIKDVPNIYLEYCRSSSVCGLIGEGSATIGAGRLMFGSDQDLFDPGYALGAYFDTKFSAAEAKQVMYSNAKKLTDCRNSTNTLIGGSMDHPNRGVFIDGSVAIISSKAAGAATGRREGN